MSESTLPQKEITFDYLHDVVKYHELHDKLKELGVGEVWSTRIKKKEVINKALAALAKLKKIKQENPNSSDEEILEKIDLMKAQEQESAKEELISQEEKEFLKQQNIQKINKKQLSKEDILKNIRIIDNNLANNIAGQREVLLAKRVSLEKLLE